MGKLSVKRYIIDFLLIFAIAVLLALTYTIFIIPNDFAPAGINGIATMVQKKLGFSIGYFSLIVNVPLCILAYFFVNKQFAIKSLVFCLVYSGSYLLFTKVIDFTTFQYNAKGVNTIFPCLIAGMIGGLVYGLCFRVNACTGGTDIVAKWISQKKPLLNFFWITFAMNAVVAFSSLFVFVESESAQIFSYEPVCLCMLYCFLSSFIGNRILQGYKTAYLFTIVTEHPDEIENDIITILHHSATRIKGNGIYSGSEKVVLSCVVNKHQVVDFKSILSKYSNTFTYIELINETVGNFKKIK